MPNLHTLQFIPDHPNNNIDWCHCHHWDNHDYCQPDSPCGCPLISKLRPRKLIYGNKINGACKSSLGFWPYLPSLPPIWLEEIVLYASHVDGIAIGPECSNRWTKSDMKQNHHLKRLTIVLQSGDGMEIGGLGRDGMFKRDFTAGGKEAWSSGELWNRLAMAIEGKPEVMEVVGLELVFEGWKKASHVSLNVNEVREELIKVLKNKGWVRDFAKDVVQKIIFTEKAEYKDQGGS